jgi:murein DD-endopeptidase MepM/ murein hydrolase activator NlpD
MTVYVDNMNDDETVKIECDAVKINTQVYSYNNRYVAILPIDLDTKPGDYELTATLNEGKTSEYKTKEILTVTDKIFKTQYLTVTEDLNQSNNSNDAIIEFIKTVKPARLLSVSEKLWEGPFIMPVNGTLTTDFAEIRYVNDEKSSSRHSGIDLAAPIGTEVKAPNNGVVTLATNGLMSTGNTIVVDHGMGLFTSYYHLDSILVKVGEQVNKGDVIGTVGTTGFSTGAHLHYALSIYNTYVNTYQTLSGIID